jgi:pyrimidine oxygenase
MSLARPQGEQARETAMDMGVFIPIGNNGWLISTTSPQYKPSFELNKQVVQRAEHHGLDFALSMIKLRGFGGKSEFWDHNLESFTLMAGLAAVTSRIQLYASVAVLTIPPAIVARMASTIDSISGGRFGVNIVSGWAKMEYEQMGLWPGEVHFAKRYDYSTEYVTILRELWETGTSDFKGEYFQMEDCKLSPRPQADMKIVCAGQSPRGMEFGATYGNYNFTISRGINTPTAHIETNALMAAAAAKTGRDVGNYVLVMIIAGETDEAAWGKWKHYNVGIDHDALTWMTGEAKADPNLAAGSTADVIGSAGSAINFTMGTLIGSYANIARMLDEMATVTATKGIMMVFDDFVAGVEQFGQHIQPLMQCRRDKLKAVA